jgi:hypothetical protein
MTNFWVKITLILSVLAKKSFLYQFKTKIIFNFMIFVVKKNVGTKKIFPFLFRCCWIPFIATVADPGRFYAHRDTTFHFLITDFNVTTTEKHGIIVLLLYSEKIFT